MKPFQSNDKLHRKSKSQMNKALPIIKFHDHQDQVKT